MKGTLPLYIYKKPWKLQDILLCSIKLSIKSAVRTAGIRMCSWRRWSTGHPWAWSPRWAQPPSPSEGWSPRWSWSAAHGLWSPSSTARTRTNSTTFLSETWRRKEEHAFERRTAKSNKSNRRAEALWNQDLMVKFLMLSDLSRGDYCTKRKREERARWHSGVASLLDLYVIQQQIRAGARSGEGYKNNRHVSSYKIQMRQDVKLRLRFQDNKTFSATCSFCFNLKTWEQHREAQGILGVQFWL